jgi:hypothetical protein
MDGNRSHLKQLPQRFSLHQQGSDTMQTLLTGEGYLLELISTGAPLPTVLDKVCTAIDAQVRNVASLVLLPDDDEHYLHTIAQSAAHFEFSIFRSTGIFSRSGDLLGTFEMYCCFPRTPSPGEMKLIERATHLAALAIQRHNYTEDSGHKEDSGSFSEYWRSAMERSSHEIRSSKN